MFKKIMGIALILAPISAFAQEPPVDKTIEALRIEVAESSDRLKKIEASLQQLLSRAPAPPPIEKQVDDAIKAFTKACPKGTKYVAVDRRPNGGLQCIVKVG